MGLSQFQPTSPARGTTGGILTKFDADAISTHVPREGDDHLYYIVAVAINNISTHVPREGDDRL